MNIIKDTLHSNVIFQRNNDKLSNEFRGIGERFNFYLYDLRTGNKNILKLRNNITNINLISSKKLSEVVDYIRDINAVDKMSKTKKYNKEKLSMDVVEDPNFFDSQYEYERSKMEFQGYRASFTDYDTFIKDNTIYYDGLNYIFRFLNDFED